MYIMKNILATLLEINVENMESTETTKELEQAIEDKFLTPSRFAIEIEKIVAEENCNYIDAICHYCEVNGLEIESVTKLVSKASQRKIEV
jgi:hypothetical protein